MPLYRLRARLAFYCQVVAARISPETGPRSMGGVTFTFEDGLGMVIRTDHRGCPLWYMSEDYERAHDQSGGLRNGYLRTPR